MMLLACFALLPPPAAETEDPANVPLVDPSAPRNLDDRGQAEAIGAARFRSADDRAPAAFPRSGEIVRMAVRYVAALR